MKTHTARWIGLTLAVVALGGLFVFFGGTEPAPERHDYAGAEELGSDPERYVGEPVELGGVVVGTDPVVVEIEHADGSHEYVVEGAPAVETGQQLSVFGRVTAPAGADAAGSLTAEETVVRDAWESTYMYAVSLLAVGWVAVRAVRHWRFSIRELAFVPRGERDG